MIVLYIILSIVGGHPQIFRSRNPQEVIAQAQKKGQDSVTIMAVSCPSTADGKYADLNSCDLVEIEVAPPSKKPTLRKK